MRIAIWYNLPSGGGKRALYNHVRGLLERGHTLEAWCPPTADRQYAALADLIPEHVVELGRYGHRWDTRFRRSLGPFEPMRQRIHSVERHCHRCATAIDSGRFDVVLVTSCRLVVVPPIGKYLQTPSVLYLQEPGRNLYEARPRQFWVRPEFPTRLTGMPQYVAKRATDAVRTKRHRALGFHEWVNVRQFGTVLVNSAFSRESLLRAYGYDSRVCYLGIDTSFFRPLGLTRQSMLIGIGEVRPHKNLELIVEAMGAMQSPRPRLVWVGNTYDRNYRARIAHLALRHNVRIDFRMRVDDRELRQLLNTATAMVYAPRLEPFGLAPVEAAACGLPVVSTAEGGVRESVVNEVTGILVEHDAIDMARAISQLVNDPATADELGRGGRAQAVARFSLDAAAARVESYLERTAHNFQDHS